MWGGGEGELAFFGELGIVWVYERMERGNVLSKQQICLFWRHIHIILCIVRHIRNGVCDEACERELFAFSCHCVGA